jgi:hypothetical protein
MSIYVRGMPWPQAVLLVADDQQLELNFEGSTLHLSQKQATDHGIP